MSTDSRMSSGLTKRVAVSKSAGERRLPVHLAPEHVGAPLLMRTLQRLRLARCPVQPDLHEKRLALTATAPERLHHPSELFRLGADGQQTVGPTAYRFCRRLRHSGSELEWRRRRS